LETAIENIVNTVYQSQFALQDNFICAQDVLALREKIELLEKNKQLKQAGIGKNSDYLTNPEIRSDAISWLEQDDEFLNSVFFSKINELQLQLNRRLYLGLNDHEFHFAFYKPGTFYKKHRDAFKSDDARKITVILYLNTNWQKADGGELQLFLEKGDPIIIEPLAGRLLVFESHMEHEVLESHANRYSITGWLKNKSRLF
jgi:SM-20-related protein